MDKFLSENKVSEGISEKCETEVVESVNPDVENQGSKVIGKKVFMLSEYNDYVPDFSVYGRLSYPVAVRAMCKQCCCYQTKEVILCQSKSCPLWPIKEFLYKNSVRKKNLLESEKEEDI